MLFPVIILSAPCLLFFSAVLEEVSAFASYGRAFIYLCSTCNSGVEANDIFIEIQDENYLNTQKWVPKDGMEYNMQGEQNTAGSITYYIAVRKK